MPTKERQRRMTLTEEAVQEPVPGSEEALWKELVEESNVVPHDGTCCPSLDVHVTLLQHSKYDSWLGSQNMQKYARSAGTSAVICSAHLWYTSTVCM